MFLEKCIEQWEEFQKLYQRCESWLKRTELLVGRETYGYTLKETETYMADIKVRGFKVQSRMRPLLFLCL